MKDYEIEVWFNFLAGKKRLGKVIIKAHDELEALSISINNTEYWVVDSPYLTSKKSLF